MKTYSHFSIRQYFKDLDIDFKIHDAEDHKEVVTNCPMCVENEGKPDTRNRLWINEKKGRFNCFNCGWSGILPYLVRKFSNTNLLGALKILKGKTSELEYLNFSLVEPDEDEDEETDRLKEIEFPYGFELFEDHKKKITPFHTYLKKRGIPIEYAIEHGWGFSTVGYCKNRIVVPTYMNDRLVFWQARDILEKRHPNWGDKKLYKKVYNPKGVSARHVLYNFDQAKNYDEIVLVEGFTDASKVGPFAMAINGKKLHSAQVEHLIQTKVKSIVLLLDPDAFTDVRRYQKGPKKGKIRKPSSVRQAVSLLSIYYPVRVVRLPEGRDAGSYPVGALSDVIKNKAYRIAR